MANTYQAKHGDLDRGLRRNEGGEVTWVSDPYEVYTRVSRSKRKRVLHPQRSAKTDYGEPQHQHAVSYTLWVSQGKSIADAVVRGFFTKGIS